MNKSLFLLPILLASSSLSGISGEYHIPTVSENHPILIHPVPSEIPDAPRMPAYNPFFAELMNDYVILGAPSAIGTVSVSLTSTAGDNYSTCFDTSDGAILLPVSGNAGYYTLTIITADGTHYVGEFTI